MVSFSPVIFQFALFGASLASALSAIVGCAQTLQAIANDEIFPILEAFKDSRRGVLMTALVCTVFMLVSSSLNTMAVYATVFFLFSYAGVNVACFLLTISGSPNFR
jgi:potassium/chloride transporter 9